MTDAGLMIALWNTEWAAKRSRRGRLIREYLHDASADVLCLTEGSEGLLPDGGHVILSGPDYGYAGPAERRKVLLWSRQPWTDVDDVGSAALPGGRYVRGRTNTTLGELDVVGVCIPWRDAHVRTGKKNRRPWEDHQAYLAALQDVLPDPSTGHKIVLGDVNQRVPRMRVPTLVFDQFRQAFSEWTIATEGPIGPSGLTAIDHLAHGASLVAGEMQVLPMRASCGTRLSDHFGLRISMRGRWETTPPSPFSRRREGAKDGLGGSSSDNLIPRDLPAPAFKLNQKYPSLTGRRAKHVRSFPTLAFPADVWVASASVRAARRPSRAHGARGRDAGLSPPALRVHLYARSRADESVRR